MVLQGRVHLITETLGIRGTKEAMDSPLEVDNCFSICCFSLDFSFYAIPFVKTALGGEYLLHCCSTFTRLRDFSVRIGG
jgi:hypothetical protein